MKTIWLASKAATAVVGNGVMVKSIGPHNDYEIRTDDAAEIRGKYRTLDIVYPICFGAAIFSGA